MESVSFRKINWFAEIPALTTTSHGFRLLLRLLLSTEMFQLSFGAAFLLERLYFNH